MCSKPRGATSQYLDGHLRRLFGGLLSTGDFDLDLLLLRSRDRLLRLSRERLLFLPGERDLLRLLSRDLLLFRFFFLLGDLRCLSSLSSVFT